MTSFIAIYRGSTIGDARLIAVSTDPGLVADVSGRLLKSRASSPGDAAIGKLEQGRRAALRVIKKEAVESGAEDAAS
jgi:hypothetical protein